MELTPQEIDLIDRHFKNELTKEESAAFNARLAADSVFADEVNKYRKSIDVIGVIGRQQLRSELIAIQKEVENSDSYESYKPGGKKKTGGGGSGFIGTVIFILIIAAAYYYYNSHKESMNKIENIFVPSEPDTVYHYRIKKDTVKTEGEKKYKVVDTVYFDQKGNQINRNRVQEKFEKKSSTKVENSRDSIQ